MRQHMHLANGLTGRIALAVLVAVVTATCCAARIAASPVEGGCPSEFINTPVCVEDFDDGFDCGAFGWAESRLYIP
jgi:hypothetical protein